MINQNKIFKKIYYKGNSWVSPTLVTYILKNYHKGKRLGITTSKKIGNAVYRNRCRRVIKEAFRMVQPYIKNDFDFIFVARTKTGLVKMQTVLKDMVTHIKKAGIWF